MKKLLLLSLLAVTFAACEGPAGADGLPGYNGLPGQDGQNGQQGVPGKDGEGVKWENIVFDIKASDWKLGGLPNELNSYYYCIVDVPEITDYVFDYGTIIGYIEPETDLKNGLPFVVHEGEKGAGGEDLLYTRTYDFDFTPGTVKFIVTYSDFMTGIMKPGNERYHLVLMW